MKTVPGILAILAASAGLALAADTITTTDGKTYDHITSLRADPDGLYIEYTPVANSLAAAKIKFTRLSEDLQKQYGYDADAAKKYEADQAAGALAFQSWADQQDAARQKARADAAARDLQEESLELQRQALAASQQYQAAPPPSDMQSYDGYGGWSYGNGYGYGYGRLASPNSFTGSTYTGHVPQAVLFTPIGFSPTKIQVNPATPPPRRSVGQSRPSVQPHF